MEAAGCRRPAVIDTDPSSSFVCDYVAGVNRVLSLPPYLLVDNIGRNLEVWRFQSGEREPAARALYDATTYPGDPMASLLDVDLHAAFLRGAGRELVTVNHFGRLRVFGLPAAGARLQPAWELQLLGDTERIVMAGDCLIASSPRGEFTDDPSQPGVFLFAPLAVPDGSGMGETRRLACDQVLPDWGVIGALAVSPAADRLAVAAGPRLGVFELACSGAGLRLGGCLWEAPLRFHCQWLHFDNANVWAGGHRPPSSAAASDDWDACCGGGITAFAADSGTDLVTVTLPDATAWGYGADPVILANGGRTLYVLGRDASLEIIDTTAGASHRLYGRVETTDDVTPSLGIGHLARRDGWLYAGFSRGGFRLLRYLLE